MATPPKKTDDLKHAKWDENDPDEITDADFDDIPPPPPTPEGWMNETDIMEDIIEQHEAEQERAKKISEIASFAAAMRGHQLQWALNGGIPRAALEERQGKTSWVLKPEHCQRNLYKSNWWKYIAGKEHRWARALNSSQCFGVNLFGPLAEDNNRARRVLNALLPDQRVSQQDTVSVHFEHSPKGAAEWLGERGQGTQVDVFFEVRRADREATPPPKRRMSSWKAAPSWPGSGSAWRPASPWLVRSTHVLSIDRRREDVPASSLRIDPRRSSSQVNRLSSRVNVGLSH